MKVVINIKKIANIGGLSLALGLLLGCVTTPPMPHTFVNTYTPIPESFFESLEGEKIYTVKGSGFLRQRGGGTVSCAGSEVYVKAVAPTSAYSDEYFKLRKVDRDASIVDPNFIADQQKLNSFSENTFCDVSGNFEVKLPVGRFKLSTNISWEVADTCGYGDYTYACMKTQGGMRSQTVSIADNLDKLEYKIIIN